MVPNEGKLGDLLESRIDLWFQAQLNPGAEMQSSGFNSSSCPSIFTPWVGGAPFPSFLGWPWLPQDHILLL